MSTFLLGYCLGIGTIVGISAVFGVIVLLKAREADSANAGQVRADSRRT